MIEAEAKFNSGNGGVMVRISRENALGFGDDGEKPREMGELLSPRKAIDFALLVLHKATDVPPELDAAIRKLKEQEKW